MEILKNYSLKNHNTFGIDAKADFYVSIRNNEEIEELINTSLFQNDKFFILGGGSNVLFTGNFKGLIIDINIRGIKILETNDDKITIEVGAGEHWDDLVTICLNNKFFGLENLALIPGKVGAAPVQNIGAYAVEQKDFFYSLTGYNIEKKQFETLNYDDCKFNYRDSVFKHELKNNFIITQVRYKLNKNENINLSYKELSQEISKFNIEKPDAKLIYDTVRRLRTHKLPDYRLLGNAGSFFKNPIISKGKFDKLKEIFTELQGYTLANNKVKVSAGWLIEQCGWKGRQIGKAGVSEKHALIIVNHGNAKGHDILNLSEQIKQSIIDKYDIELENEVLIIE
ncbi:MAG: UDP-N-acetylenolpyruvoylglucosamine reductase [Ignavibacteria bacterium GWB2_35_12]|nr:MAG: UDP-N-acetylenolpyruvoylglucosamine reductase [Ignavibacteria bacterium GWA2_35_8]OGU40692.1 MAG: UDP-N-acetylenolpyruvoylglucosamine reductase [Ignavibacteria bacterium GWB2_35_12]OGV22403.1 MAG: UDP-N-acetylenolpyruvoylglucosamine reductase [Ignavibacteria bacterium RIFOXYC2_FULL_35_21]